LYANIQKHGWDREWDETRFHYLWDQRSHSDPRTPEFWTGEFGSSEFNREPNSKVGFQFGLPDEHREVADDRLASEVAWETIRQDPSTFVKSCLVRMSWFWAVTPYRSGAASVMIVAIGLWYSVLFAGIVLASGVLLSQRWGKGGLRKAFGVLLIGLTSLRLWVPAFSLVVSLQLVHLIYWSNMRMRAPLMPVLYILFAVGLFFAFESMRRGKSLMSPIAPSN
jgi:hypothetical protein